MEQSKVNQILRVAKMYYELKMSQQDIGAKENISKSTVSRLLKNAMDEGFVEVRIRQPHYALADLEAEFTNRFGIRKVVIAADVVENREVLVQDVCSAMAADLPKCIEDDSLGTHLKCPDQASAQNEQKQYPDHPAQRRCLKSPV